VVLGILGKENVFAINPVDKKNRDSVWKRD
jgi:hypothetical protein